MVVALDYAFASHAKVVSVQVNKDCWTLEAVVPLGAFHAGDSAKYQDLSLQVGRTRRAGVDAQGNKTQELSTSHATQRLSFSDVRTFVPLKLEKFKGDAFTWQLNDAAFKTFRQGDDIVLEANCSVINAGKRFSFCKVRGVLLDRKGSEVAVAENGCVWVPQTMKERAVLFISECLVIIVDRKDIVSNMHQAYERISNPGYGCFISGPSKTADIAQALVMGAQAARDVLYVIV